MLGGTIPEERNAAGAMDLNAFPRDNDHSTMMQALKDGTVTEATITAAARRVLYEIDRFGYLDGKQKHNVTPQDIEENAAVIKKTGEDAAVLLKNQGALPLKADDLHSLAFIGPTAGQIDAIGTFGERSGGLAERQIGPIDAMRKLAPDAQINYAVDDDMTGTPIPASALTHGGQPGLERTGSGAAKVDVTIDFTHTNGQALTANAEYTWKGTLTVPIAGDYWLYLQVIGARGMLSIDGKEVGRTGSAFGTVHGDIQHATQDNAIPTTDGLDNVRRGLQLTAGAHEITITSTGDTSGNPEQIRLNWVTPEDRERNHQAAIAAAKSAHTAVVFLWTRGKPVFGLPGEQNKLVEEIAAVNPNTIVVLNTSQPVAMPWADKVKGILEMWWPGDEGGWSTADLLLGKASPAGRLPITWAKQLTDYPATDPKYPERSEKGVDKKTTFTEGVNIGYRWFEKEHIAPMYPFGYGLSYTTFAYSGIRAAKTADGGVDVTVDIKNTGALAGDEVPQVYLDAPKHQPTGVQFAPTTLASFDRVSLAPGETKTVTLHIAPRAYEYWSVADKKWVRAADRRIQVGSSSRDLKLNIATP
jgi:beta-glucosidase